MLALGESEQSHTIDSVRVKELHSLIIIKSWFVRTEFSTSSASTLVDTVTSSMVHFNT